jgi:acetyltransferase
MNPLAPEIEFRDPHGSGRRKRPLEALFSPKSVAVIGATEKAGSVGLAVMQNLRPFPGRVHPINPKRAHVCGVPAVPSISALPEPPDLAVLVTPAAAIPGLLAECGAVGVPAAIIISAGFKEVGPDGVRLEAECLEVARRTGMRLLGPNCLGLMAPPAGLNATFAADMAASGGVAFLSQSGALCTAVLDWSLREKVGFSAFVSVGSMLDVGWGDLITHFGDDPDTRSIVCYMESVGDARAFLSAAREVALTKPIVVLKVGRTEAAARAAASHTGSLTGSDAVLDAAFHRVGVLRVNTIGELFNMAELLAKEPLPKGPRLTIVTNAGGPGALAADALSASGGELAGLSPELRKALDELLPPHWSRNNPIDVLGDADSSKYACAVELAANDPETDGVMVVLTPQAMTDCTGTAEALRSVKRPPGKPLLTSWMGGPAVDLGREALNAGGIPTFNYPDTAARAFALMWRYSRDLKLIYETPALDSESPIGRTHADLAGSLIEAVAATGRTLRIEAASFGLRHSHRADASGVDGGRGDAPGGGGRLPCGAQIVVGNGDAQDGRGRGAVGPQGSGGRAAGVERD